MSLKYVIFLQFIYFCQVYTGFELKYDIALKLKKIIFQFEGVRKYKL